VKLANLKYTVLHKVNNETELQSTLPNNMADKKTVLAFTNWLLWRNRTMKMVNVQKEREKSPRFDDKTSISSRKDNKIDEFRPATYSR
jgi:hypothetical protein